MSSKTGTLKQEVAHLRELRWFGIGWRLTRAAAEMRQEEKQGKRKQRGSSLVGAAQTEGCSRETLTPLIQSNSTKMIGFSAHSREAKAKKKERKGLHYRHEKSPKEGKILPRQTKKLQAFIGFTGGGV